MDNRPIGVFDSGLGGLTVVKEIKKILPNEQVIYLGDTARVPYGTRSKETITKFAVEDVQFLLKFNVKVIVIACNTVSSVATNYLKKRFHIKFVDVITATCKGVSNIKNIKRIGIIGTPATIKSKSYYKGIKKYKKSIQIFQNASPLLVPIIEENEITSLFTLEILKKYLKPLIKNNIDLLILGCTHYPILQGLINKIVGKKVRIINPALYVSHYLNEYLIKSNLLSEKVKSVDKFFVTDLTDSFIKQLKIFFGLKSKNILVKTFLT